MRILDQMERNNDGSMYEITFPELQSEQITSPPNRGGVDVGGDETLMSSSPLFIFDTSNTSE